MIEEQCLKGSRLEVDVGKETEIHLGKQCREVMGDIDTRGLYILN